MATGDPDVIEYRSNVTLGKVLSRNQLGEHFLNQRKV